MTHIPCLRWFLPIGTSLSLSPCRLLRTGLRSERVLVAGEVEEDGSVTWSRLRTGCPGKDEGTMCEFF